MYRFVCLLLAVLATTNGKYLNDIERIVGGENAAIENFPYQVSVRFSGSHICGGSILNSRIIVSAAHCFFDGIPLSAFSIQYGSTNRNDGKTVQIERLDKHEGFNSNTIDNDIAIIHLAEDIVFAFNAKPIALANKLPDPGTNAVVSGWGRTSEESIDLPKILQKLNVQIVDHAVCRKLYGGNNVITDRMLCAGVNGGAGGKGPCQTDSGGPLVANNELVGIVSFSIGCGHPEYPGVYADVVNLRQWIDSKIKQD